MQRPLVTITADNVELKQLDTRGGSFGIAAENVRGVKLQTVRVRDAQADGIFLRNAEKVFLNKCKSYNNGAHGILLKQNDLGAGNVIKKCRVYDNSGYGVMLEQAPGTRVESCRIYDNDRVGIYGDHAVRSLKILKNRVWGHSEIGIRFGYESYDHLVEGNVCSNNGVGIDLSGSAGVARRNVCEKNEVGFFIGMSAWLVESNKAKKNTSHGFELDDNVEGSDNSLAKNESTDNGGSGFRILRALQKVCTETIWHAAMPTMGFTSHRLVVRVVLSLTTIRRFPMGVMAFVLLRTPSVIRSPQRPSSPTISQTTMSGLALSIMWPT